MRVRIFDGQDGTRLPTTAFTSQPWHLHQIAGDFRVEDVWQLPGVGERDDFPRVVELMTALDPSRSSLPARVLWAIRWKLGTVLGWDDDGRGLGARVPTLRDRLPRELRASAPPDFGDLPFSPLYLTDDEYAAEIANQTMHGVLHLGWVPGDDGRYRAQMAVLVKPNGWLGEAYMLAIRPFRHLVVYPALMREGRRRWERETGVAAVN